MRERNIYHRLIKNEDTFTEAFVNLLHDDNIRESFINFIRNQLKIHDFNFWYEEIDTQVIGLEGERPDVIIQNEDYYVIIENKINSYTALTSNQPQGYIKHLKKQKQENKFLIFTIPTSYTHKTELENRIDNLTSYKDYIHILNWEDILEGMTEASDEAYYIDFLKIAGELMNYKKISLEQVDVQGINNPNSFLKLYYSIDNLKKLLQTNGKKVTDDKNEYNYGIYIENEKEKYGLYIGIVYDLWLQQGEPYYFGIDKKKESNVTQLVRNQEKIYKNLCDADWQYVNIPLASIIDQNDSAKFLMDRISQYID